jgi:hypothetical protein
MITLADLDRDELLALAVSLGASSMSQQDLRTARIGGALARERAAYDTWQSASARAIADAQATKRYVETKGYDSCYRALFQKAKASSRRAADLWKVYEDLSRKRQRLEREMRVS